VIQGGIHGQVGSVYSCCARGQRLSSQHGCFNFDNTDDPYDIIHQITCFHNLFRKRFWCTCLKTFESYQTGLDLGLGFKRRVSVYS